VGKFRKVAARPHPNRTIKAAYFENQNSLLEINLLFKKYTSLILSVNTATVSIRIHSIFID
jgi:hypothetical protein